MKPMFHSVTRVVRETNDVVTLDVALDPSTDDAPRFAPGQFNMLYMYGVGEIAVSISGDAAQTDHFAHTIRAVGPVSQALTDMQPDQQIGVRGPFGTAWPMAAATGKDVLIIAGGLGIAPLRPAIYHLQNHRHDFGDIGLLVGARSPADLPFIDEVSRWQQNSSIQCRVTVDHAGPDWRGDVGLVTEELNKVRFNPDNAIAMICGPEIMIRMTARQLQDLGVSSSSIHVSLERNMKCATGFCGHCQFGPHFICRDGPVFPIDRVQSIMKLREI